MRLHKEEEKTSSPLPCLNAADCRNPSWSLGVSLMSVSSLTLEADALSGVAKRTKHRWMMAQDPWQMELGLSWVAYMTWVYRGYWHLGVGSWDYLMLCLQMKRTHLLIQQTFTEGLHGPCWLTCALSPFDSLGLRGKEETARWISH